MIIKYNLFLIAEYLLYTVKKSWNIVFILCRKKIKIEKTFILKINSKKKTKIRNKHSLLTIETITIIALIKMLWF